MAQKSTLWLISGVIGCLCTGCMQPGNDSAPMTQLQIRQLETREFETKDSKLVMKSMMNVLQDEGFVIKNAVMDLGLLSAEKSLDIEDKSSAFLSLIFAGEGARWNKEQTMEASANVSEFGDTVRVRITFQAKTTDNWGRPVTVAKVTNPAFYQEFFDKVNKSVFIQQENV
jgi:hypothetical protein